MRLGSNAGNVFACFCLPFPHSWTIAASHTGTVSCYGTVAEFYAPDAFFLFFDALGVSTRQEERPASPEIEHSTRQSAAPLARLGLDVIKGHKSRDEETKDVVAQSGICQTKPHVMGTSFS